MPVQQLQFESALATDAANKTAGVLFVFALLTVGTIWWTIVRRRQTWWWGYTRRPGDNTGERWIRSNEARADKPMPERRMVVDHGSRRRRTR